MLSPLNTGFISCGSSSSSKPTTPVPITNSLVSSDKTSDESEGGVEEDNNYRNHSRAECSISKLNKDDVSGELINTTSDNESGKKLVLNNNNVGGDNSPPSTSSLSVSRHGAKVRSKHRNSSLTDQSSSSASTTVRYRKKHISLDDEIVIYESDSSLVESRRRLSNSTRSHHRHLQFNSSRGGGGGNSDNQGRASVAISRHKSEENPSFMQPSNQIVSILKRKDSAGTGSSGGGNGNQSPSLVTFSPNVKDVEARSAHRQGILKKRSSLDESSRRYRSHSPSSASSESEKGCMRKSYRRRNSCEEIHHHGILKQKSYESTGYSSSSGVNTPNSTSSSGVQGILKKPSLTPSDHSNEQVTKHVSISEAVILAAAELCKDMVIDESYGHEPYIKPILKLDNNDHHSLEIRPKPILKKNHSSENEEIRSILKSRKSSREEDS